MPESDPSSLRDCPSKKALLATTAALLGTTAFARFLPHADNKWLTAGQAMIAEKTAGAPNTNRAKNGILRIADGNGVGTAYATHLSDGQQNWTFRRRERSAL